MMSKIQAAVPVVQQQSHYIQVQPIQVNRIDFASIEIPDIYDRSDFVATRTILMGCETLFVDVQNQNKNQLNQNANQKE